MEPEAFRLNLNALVQDLRNVTWLLQRQKHELQDFDQWYRAWLDSASDDPVMQWIVSARNRVVHMADLEIHSHALVRLSCGWGDDEVKVPTMALMAKSPLWTDDYKAYAKKLAPGLDYREFDGVGHFLFMERPKEINAALAEFLKKQGVLK